MTTLIDVYGIYCSDYDTVYCTLIQSNAFDTILCLLCTHNLQNH